MPTFDIVKKQTAKKSFKVESVIGMFDLQSNEITEKFTGNIDIDNQKWNVGIIYGASGTGKSTIAKQIFGNGYIKQYEYSNKSIIDEMPNNKTVKEITHIFNSVGFSSPPSWLKTYDVLSNGEKMRVDIARAILEEKEYICFDEFTSVINREVAQIGSFALQKAIRKLNKQFIAISCHYDIIEWLEPDWTFCTDNMAFFLTKISNDQRLDVKYLNQNERIGGILKSITI